MKQLDFDFTEQWRPIVGWEGLYDVSSHGRVRSYPRYRTQLSHKKTEFVRIYRGHILRPGRSNAGYATVTLQDAPRKECLLLHILVCEAFHGPRPDGHIVAHGDGSRLNNRSTNLRWATPEQNWEDRRLHGTANQGEANGYSSLTDDIVIYIRRSDRSARELSAKLRVARSTISDIRARRRWKHLP